MHAVLVRQERSKNAKQSPLNEIQTSNAMVVENHCVEC
jgi:hypothetical protein